MSYLTQSYASRMEALAAALAGQGFTYNPLRTTWNQYLSTALGEPNAYLVKSPAQILAELNSHFGGSTVSHLRSSTAQLMDYATVSAGSGGGGVTTPANTVAPAVTGNAYVGSTLTSSTGTWSGGGTITYAYQWKSGGSNVGSNQNTYVPVTGDIGKTITCTVTASNSAGSGTPTASAATASVIGAPVNSVLPAITGTQDSGQTLTVSSGTWTGGGSISYSYQWKANGSNIGSNQNTYVVADADYRKSITCTVTATNAAGSASANSAAATLATLYLRPVATRVKQTFVATHSSDGVNTQGKYVIRHKVPPGGIAAGTMKLTYPNRCSEAGGFNSITVGSRIRYPAGSGTWYNVTWSAASSVTIAASANDPQSDAVAGHPDMIPGTWYDEEAYVTVASAGMKWPSIDNMALKGANGEGLLLSTSDISGTSVTPGDSGATEIYGASSITGMSTATRAIAIFAADSIANGALDDTTADAMGFIERKFNGTYPMLNLATSSERANQFITTHTKRMALFDASGITDVVIQIGGNDLPADSYATLRGNLLAIYALFAGKGIAITLCPILTKCSGNVNTPATGFTVGGVADQINTLISGDMGLISKFWDTRAGWQNASNQILSATYTDDLVHPNAVGNPAIAAVGGSAASLIAASIPAAPIPSQYFIDNYTYFRASDLALNDNDQITSWVDTKGQVTATWAGEKPRYRTNMTPQGKPAVKFDIAGTGLEKLVIPHSAFVDNIFGTAGIIITASRYATAGGNGTGRLWTKGVGETAALTSSTNFRTTLDFNTADVAMNGTKAANTWYVDATDCTAANVGSTRQNTLSGTATASGTGTGGHVDNSANDFIMGNHDTLARGWNGDAAGYALSKNPGTQDQQMCAHAYVRADTGVTVI